MHLTTRLPVVTAAFLLLLLSEPSQATAERPPDMTPSDFYAQKALGAATAANERQLMALVLHSAHNAVPVADFTGALRAREFRGSWVDLNGYFNGGLASANTGGDVGEAVDFLDDGGCSALGTPELPTYTGKAPMYEVHKFMDLNAAEMGYFVDQAVKGLLSFGFSSADAQFVNATLDAKFNRRCAAAEAIIPPEAGPQLQAICVALDCALAANDTCVAYGTIAAPAVANAELVGNFTKSADGKTNLNASSTASGVTPTSTLKSGSGALVAVDRTGIVLFALLGAWGVAFVSL